jgi:hypothetical protein
MKFLAVTFILLGLALGQQSGSSGTAAGSQAGNPPATAQAGRPVMPPDHPAPPPVKQAPDDPGAAKARRLIDQMIEALGGNAYMSYTDMEQSGRTYGFFHGEPSGTGTVFWRMWKWPDKERVELTKQRDWIIIHNGDQASEITFRGVQPEDKKASEDFFRRRYYSLEVVLRTWLNQPGVALFYEGLASANRRPADQVTIMNANNEGLTIYIDQNTHLPAKKTFTWRDPETRDRVDESELYDNYKQVQGIMTPLSVTRMENDQNTNQRFITTVTYNQGLPDSLFDAAAQTKPVGNGKKR